ncbi:hypothetical protein Tco_1271270 [Tanacetum coccineum]
MPKAAKKEETSGKDKALAILMVQPWERVARQKITQSFSPNTETLFPPLGEDEGTEGLMIIEAEIEGYCIHRMYVDGGSASKILYEHCFSRPCLEIKNQLMPATTLLLEFSGDNMINKANTTTGKDWRRRTLRFGLDEFHGCKVTIPVQRNYWKTRSHKIASSSVNSSRNAEALGRRSRQYSKKLGNLWMQES